VADEGTLVITPQLNVGIDADDAMLTIKDRARLVSTQASVGIDLAGIFTDGVGTVTILVQVPANSPSRPGKRLTVSSLRRAEPAT
jgi:hypothetical protein